MKRILMLMGLCASLCYTSCQSEKEGEMEEETTFEVSSPLKMDTTITKEYVCQIHGLRNIEVRAQERGYLEKIYVDEGQHVKKGQLLFQVMPKLYEAEAQKAQAEANFAKIEFQNTKRLADSDVVAPNELALAKAKYDKAQAELALANVHLGFTELRAPFDGIMDRLHVREGSLVDEGELLTTLTDNSEMWVYFNVPESEYLDYMGSKEKNEKMKVKLQMANGKIFDYPGIVETIESEFNNETGNIAFRATFPNPDRLLRHGQTGNILVTTPVHNTLLIPQKATFEVLDKKYVYVIDDENRVKSRQIEIAAELPHIYAVQDGLEPDDKILLEGLRLVREDQEIEYEFKDPKQAMSDLELYAE